MVWSILDSGFAVSDAYLRGFIGMIGDENSQAMSLESRTSPREVKYTYWILGVRNSKSGKTIVGIPSTPSSGRLLTTDSLSRVGILPSSGQTLWCLVENTAQMPRLKLGFCIHWKVATFVYDQPNGLTASLAVLSPDDSGAKSGVDSGASKYIGIEQLRWRLLIDVV